MVAQLFNHPCSAANHACYFVNIAYNTVEWQAYAAAFADDAGHFHRASVWWALLYHSGQKLGG
jgi:hypothetical protein